LKTNVTISGPSIIGIADNLLKVIKSFVFQKE